MDKNQKYFEYLKRRGFLGKIYRRFLLYPKISRLLKGRLLDVGCGIGDMLAFRPNSVGVDVNKLNIDFCLRRGLEVRPMPFDVLPFEDQSFDSILLDNVLEHIIDPYPLLKEIKRVMRSDGVLVIGVPGLRGQLCDDDHKVYYDEASLISLAEMMGFEIDCSLYMPLVKSALLSQLLKQYCVYTQWKLRR
jgi:SAM-dependent methyltransferase